MDRFGKTGVQVVSLQESCTEASGELRDLLLAIAGWVARFESARRSERTRAGLERALSQEKALGRRPGSKDRQRRKRSGYVARWERSGERERARERAVNNRSLATGTAANSVEAAGTAG